MVQMTGQAVEWRTSSEPLGEHLFMAITITDGIFQNGSPEIQVV